MLAEERLAEYRRDSQPRSASPRCPRSSDEPGSLTEYRIVAEPRVDRDLAATHQWLYVSSRTRIQTSTLPSTRPEA
jgi:hypothetical protein